jgi:hypothetical protein
MYLGVAENLAYCLMTLLMASKKSFSVMTFRRARMAYMPASVQTLRKSAPVACNSVVSKHARCACIVSWHTGTVGTQTRKQLVANATLAIHALGVDLEDLRTALEVRKAELDLTIQTTGTQQRRVERIGSVGGHQHLDVTTRIEAIELVDELEHGALHFVVAASTIIVSSATDGIDLIKEDDACLLGARHLEQLTHHASTLTDILLHQLTSDHTDEASIGTIRNGTSAQCLDMDAREKQPFNQSITQPLTQLNPSCVMHHASCATTTHTFPVPGGP